MLAAALEPEFICAEWNACDTDEFAAINCLRLQHRLQFIDVVKRRRKEPFDVGELNAAIDTRPGNRCSNPRRDRLLGGDRKHLTRCRAIAASTGLAAAVNRSPSSRVKTPAIQAAAYSPMLCPMTNFGMMPQDRSSSAKAYSRAKRAGCAYSVRCIRSPARSNMTSSSGWFEFVAQDLIAAFKQPTKLGAHLIKFSSHVGVLRTLPGKQEANLGMGGRIAPCRANNDQPYPRLGSATSSCAAARADSPTIAVR